MTQEDLNIRNIYCLLFGTWYTYVSDVYEQTERKQPECHLLPVISAKGFVETVFQIIACHQLSVVHWVMSDKLHKHQHCLLSLSRSGVVWSSVTLLTPYPWEAGLTSLLTMIDELTCYWSYDAQCDHLQLPQIKIKSCHSLPVDYGTSRDKIADCKMKHYSQTVIMSQYIQSMLVQGHLPTDTNVIRFCQQE